MEAAIHGLGTATDWTANATQARMGNRDPNAAPHGCTAAGNGKRIVIACETEEHGTRPRRRCSASDWCDLERPWRDSVPAP